MSLSEQLESFGRNHSARREFVAHNLSAHPSVIDGTGRLRLAGAFGAIRPGPRTQNREARSGGPWHGACVAPAPRPCRVGFVRAGPGTRGGRFGAGAASVSGRPRPSATVRDTAQS